MALVLAQWADLSTYLLAIQLKPWGESWLAAGLPVEVVVVGKAAGVAVTVLGSRWLPTQRPKLVWVGVGLGLAGSLTNVVGGLL